MKKADVLEQKMEEENGKRTRILSLFFYFFFRWRWLTQRLINPDSKRKVYIRCETLKARTKRY